MAALVSNRKALTNARLLLLDHNSLSSTCVRDGEISLQAGSSHVMFVICYQSPEDPNISPDAFVELGERLCALIAAFVFENAFHYRFYDDR
jgi:hypothetical protein